MRLYKLFLILWLSMAIGVSSYAQDEDYRDDDELSEETEIWGTAFYGIKTGVGLNNQNWQRGVTTNLIFTPSFDIFAETYDPGSLSILYAQFGFHQRGSSLGGFGFRNLATYKYSNAVVEIGGKRKALRKEKYTGYYLLGLRAEYTIFDNLGSATTSLYNFVDPVFVNKFVYGATVGGGFDYQLDDYQTVFVEVSFSPDLSPQYNQTQTFQVPNPFPQNGNPFVTIPAQQVRNFSLEVKIGYKWLR